MSKVDPLQALTSAGMFTLTQMGAAAAAVGGAATTVASATAKAFSGEAAFFDETVTPDRIKFLLDNTETRGGASVMEKVEGMKYILAVRWVWLSGAPAVFTPLLFFF